MKYKLKIHDHILGGSVLCLKYTKETLIEEKSTHLRKYLLQIENATGSRKKLLELNYYTIKSEELIKIGNSFIKKIFNIQKYTTEELDNFKKEFFDLKVKDLINQSQKKP